jgi:uncharacterized membrane protein YraQ (UPF0718 family)
MHSPIIRATSVIAGLGAWEWLAIGLVAGWIVSLIAGVIV